MIVLKDCVKEAAIKRAEAYNFLHDDISSARVGFKITDMLLTNRHIFAWPAVSNISKPQIVSCDKSEIVDTNKSPCPVSLGDGLCIAKTIEGAESGGIQFSSAIILLLVYSVNDILGESDNKIRVSKTMVVQSMTPLAFIEAIEKGTENKRLALNSSHMVVGIDRCIGIEEINKIKFAGKDEKFPFREVVISNSKVDGSFCGCEWGEFESINIKYSVISNGANIFLNENHKKIQLFECYVDSERIKSSIVSENTVFSDCDFHVSDNSFCVKCVFVNCRIFGSRENLKNCDFIRCEIGEKK